MVTENKIYYNNQLLSFDDVKLSLNDRAFKFGDGVFETIRINKSNIIWWDNHSDRLKHGLESLKIDYDLKKLYSKSKELIKLNKVQEGFIRISISRGDKSVGYLPLDECEASILIQTMPLRDVKFEAKNLWISSYRKIPDICLPSNAKTIANGLNSSLAKIQAVENNCFEALMLSVENNIAECSSGNIFWVKNNILYTPKNNLIKGIARAKIIELCELDIIEDDFKIECLEDADEVFISNISWLGLPIKSIEPLNYKYDKYLLCNIIRQKLLQNIEENHG
jgi:branched-chain amino acid aminotransferase